MLDIDLEEELVRAMGGKFKLTTLIQKRMIELNRGDRPLVEVEDGMTPREVVCKEILLGKVELAPREEVSYNVEQEPLAAPAEEPPPPEGGDEVAIYGSDIKKIKEQRIKELSQLLNPKK